MDKLKYPIKINVERRPTFFNVIFAIIGTALFVYLEYAINKTILYALLGGLFSIAYFFREYICQKDTYLTKILIDNDYVRFIYSSINKGIFEKIFYKNDIASFFADIHVYGLFGRISMTTTDIKIDIKNEESVQFKINNTAENSFGVTTLAFVKDLLKKHRFIPNFACKISGDSTYFREYLCKFYNNPKEHNYRMQAIKKGDIWDKLNAIGDFIGIILIIGVILFSLFLFINILPDVIFNAEKQTIEISQIQQNEFINYYEEAEKCFSEKNYKEALQNIDKAEQIYNKDSALLMLKVKCSNKLGDYEGAIVAAEQAINYKNSQSIYLVNQENGKYYPDNRLEAYRVIGQNSYKLKQYEKAEKAFSYIIDNSDYTYDYKYLQRGRCRYYLNDMDGAMQDFIKHKQIITKYIEDQKKAEYPDKYPRYNEKDLIKIQKWIENCQL